MFSRGALFFFCFCSRKPWPPRFVRGDRHPNVLILVPSLELGVQVTLVAQQIAQAWPVALKTTFDPLESQGNLRVSIVIGGPQ